MKECTLNLNRGPMYFEVYLDPPKEPKIMDRILPRVCFGILRQYFGQVWMSRYCSLGRASGPVLPFAMKQTAYSTMCYHSNEYPQKGGLNSIPKPPQNDKPVPVKNHAGKAFCASCTSSQLLKPHLTCLLSNLNKPDMCLSLCMYIFVCVYI